MKSTSLCLRIASKLKLVIKKLISYPGIGFLASKDDEVIRTQHQESRKLVGKDAVHLVHLLDLDGEPDGVDSSLDHHMLVL
eukprot:CAMPEP_0205881570 /NCGR_PEP_ID=MMETSP1083-20121108/16539_1 /ASSEMBLY_ACC=CAM_ASM_000430 /TAXON_ID=97485 /ORGANISM="Prymnesium parvum, Strain Texoma1" /LENGTH=80 /DNA_ID=CAMNT_0053244681 /DNA_START=246 /DNA_END=488 /DNA_ORIENTATION=-